MRFFNKMTTIPYTTLILHKVNELVMKVEKFILINNKFLNKSWRPKTNAIQPNTHSEL